mmetsp:Transcript_52237/g.113814  ORF Transcript_52237/g.113814 Transcript_52237/m.113814 type:complete len:83 (-) Transcript_52237:1816-2064(-)
MLILDVPAISEEAGLDADSCVKGEVNPPRAAIGAAIDSLDVAINELAGPVPARGPVPAPTPVLRADKREYCLDTGPTPASLA